MVHKKTIMIQVCNRLNSQMKEVVVVVPTVTFTVAADLRNVRTSTVLRGPLPPFHQTIKPWA